ncbi:hypothetical protein M892_26085 [Vibrio campbellii ATCC BAA-1116]|nr:hypothetical protein M892_26085 [Vibrio campbellii ATCC BAA-1116]
MKVVIYILFFFVIIVFESKRTMVGLFKKANTATLYLLTSQLKYKYITKNALLLPTCDVFDLTFSQFYFSEILQLLIKVNEPLAL